ncbi:MAG TPA: hypothetical protein VEJ46_04855 [Candidatus Acidoferrum sp.]|nr:hypothetical protein [Candidatus Acidoferrum sp.]
MITDRKNALRRKKAIIEEINQLRELLWREAVLVGVVPFVKDHIARLQAEFDELEHRFPTDTRQSVRMHLYVAA